MIMGEAYPLGRRELGKITSLFDPGAVVLGEPDGTGRVEIRFDDRADARGFVGVAVAGAHGARPFASEATPVGQASGGVTLSVLLLPEWRPGADIACPYCGRGSGHERSCPLAVSV